MPSSTIKQSKATYDKAPKTTSDQYFISIPPDTSGFLTFSGGIEKEHMPEMDQNNVGVFKIT